MSVLPGSVDPTLALMQSADPLTAQAAAIRALTRRLELVESAGANESSLYLESLAVSQQARPGGALDLADFPTGKLWIPSGDAMIEFYFELRAGAALTGALAGSISTPVLTQVFSPDGAGAYIYPFTTTGDGAGGEQYMGSGPSEASTYKGHRLDTVPNQRGSFVAVPARQISAWTGLTFPGFVQLTLRSRSSAAGAGIAISVRERRLWARARA
jgi:hypothetical protein